MNCPNCNQPLVDDSNNPGKVLCYQCRKRYPADKVADYWNLNPATTSQPQQPAQQPIQQPAPQPASQPTPQPQPQQPGIYPGPSMQQTMTTYPAGVVDPNQPYAYPPQEQKLPKGMAIAALVVGIVSLVCFSVIPVFGAIVGIVAIVLGAMTLSKVKKGIASGKGLGIGGIVTGVLATLISIAMTVLMLVGMSILMDENNYDAHYDEIANMNMTDNTYGGTEENMDSAYSYDSDEDAVTYNDNAPWTSLDFAVNGRTYKLGQTTLAQLEESGWRLDLAAAGYPEGYSVDPQQMISTIEMTGDNKDCPIYVNVANLTDEPKDIKECIITKFSIDSYMDTPTSDAFNIAGIGLGADMHQVEQAFGAPQDTYGEEGEPYINWTYQTEDYGKYLDVDFTDGKVTSFSMTTLDY